MKKKILALILATALTSTVLIGCSNTSNNKNQSTNTPPTNTTQNSSENNKETTSKQSLNGFKSELSTIDTNLEPIDVMYQLVGAVDGLKLKDNSSEGSFVEVYDFNSSNLTEDGVKNLDSLKENNELNVMGMPMKVDSFKNGYALIVSNEIKSKDQILELFNSYFK